MSHTDRFIIHCAWRALCAPTMRQVNDRLAEPILRHVLKTIVLQGLAAPR